MGKIAICVVCLILGGLFSPCYAVWHCGDIVLPQAPTAVVQDPISRDLWIGLEGTNIARIHEASSRFDLLTLAGTVNSLALDVPNRLLHASHGSLNLISIIGVDTGETTLVNVGQSPASIVVDPIRSSAYVACRGDSAIYKIDNQAVSLGFACPGVPMEMALDPYDGMLFVTIDSGFLLEINPSTGDTTMISLGANPVAIEIDPITRIAYVATVNPSCLKCYLIEQDSLFSLPLNGYPKDLALNRETSHLFVTQSPNLLTIVNTQSLSTQDFLLPAEPTSVSLDLLSDRCFVSLPGARLLAEVDGNGDTILVSTGGQVSDLLVNPITNKVYALKPSEKEIAVFEAANYRGLRVPAGGGPGSIAINMQTHKAYIPNWFTANVTVIDGYTNQTSKFKVPDGPNDVVVNPITDDVYVLCAWGNQVNIRKPNGDTLNVPTGIYSHGIALNPNTSKLYVSNRFSDDITMVDIESRDTTLIKVGAYPCDLALNLETNTAYAPNRTSWSVVALDGAFLTKRFVKVGPGPTQVRVNPLTNMIFSVDSNQRSISAINGETLERRIIPVGTTPRAMSINLNTNTLYVSSGLDGEIAVIDGTTYRSKPVKCIQGVFEVRVDQYLDKAYTVSWDRPVAYVIDGNFLTSLEIPVGEEPHFAAYDPVLEKLYISNHADNSVEIIKLREKIAPRIEVGIESLDGDTCTTRTPVLRGWARSTHTRNNYGIMKVLCKIDNLRGEWREASVHGSGTEVTWEFTTEPLILGTHLIFAVAIDSTASSIGSTSNSCLMAISDIACYEFTCLSPSPEPPKFADHSHADENGRIMLRWEPLTDEIAWYQLEIGEDPDFSTHTILIDRITATSWTIDPDLVSSQSIYLRLRSFDYPHGKPSIFSETYRYEIEKIDPGDKSLGAMVRIFPNPSAFGSPTTIEVEGVASPVCEIYDIQGRLVARLKMSPAGNRFVAEWDFRSNQDLQVSPGVYFAQVATEFRPVKRKIVVLK
ncbi:MAG: T9SS type A sorting domain-containing protein [bacterium]